MINPYTATLFLDVALLSAALFMNVCSDNASLFCTSNALRLLTAFCSLDLNKTFFPIGNIKTLSFQSNIKIPFKQSLIYTGSLNM